MATASQRDWTSPPQTDLRKPSDIMRLARMGSFFPTRLSFLRSLLRELACDECDVKCEKCALMRTRFALTKDGFGIASYRLTMKGRPLTLICYSSALDDEQRTDRVIAEAWDACFVLFDGVPSDDEVEALAAHATKQEAGRYDERVLVLSRANKSVRLFEHVASALAKGRQPDEAAVSATGYLMRTTAVYGNGKFGLADRADTVEAGISQPFRLEMLAVYLIREFTLDLVNHVAKAHGGENAVSLSPEIEKRLGIGNSTGLGMAPFLVSHPILINNWMQVRETALARVKALETASEETRDEFAALCEQVSRHLADWNVDDVPEQKRIVALRQEWRSFAGTALRLLKGDRPWHMIVAESGTGSSDLQELIVSLVLEPHGELIDGLCDCMEASEDFALDPSMRLAEFRTLLDEHYDWALEADLTADGSDAMVWYVSEDKLEPRFGRRAPERPDFQEMPHAIAHMVQQLAADLAGWADEKFLAQFLAGHPEHRFIARRVQLIAKHPYGEIRDNLVDGSVRPIDLLRCKLSFFGASRFDPRSDRWTRITLYQGAPRFADLKPDNAADCFLPAFS